MRALLNIGYYNVMRGYNHKSIFILMFIIRFEEEETNDQMYVVDIL